MKKQVISAISKCSLCVLLLVSAIAVQAQPVSNKSDEKVPGVKYLGVQGEMVLFNVAFDNPTGNKFSVIVLDRDKNVLFREIYTDKQFDKKFKLPKNEKDNITFIIKSNKGTDLLQSFDINVNNRFVEDIAVRRVD